MNTFLVADGGGTKTDFLWFDEAGRVLATARTGASNATFIPPPQAAQVVGDGIRACLGQVHGASQPNTILLFIPGFAPALPLLKQALAIADIQLMDDFWNAFYGALGSPYGIVALAGTGSFAAGRSRPGPLYTVGGWGPLFGDGGSGYHLGVLCLQAVTRREDEGKPGGLLTKMLLEHMGITDVVELRSAAYSPAFTRGKVAELSFLVREAADRGDPDAAALFDRLAGALLEEVKVLARRIGADGLSVSLTGGMAKAGQWFVGAFERAVRRELPEMRYTPARYDPLIGGALYLLSEQRGEDISDGILAGRLARQSRGGQVQDGNQT